MEKERITATAFGLFARYGIKLVSMDQIAEALQISKKTLYVNFESKEELFCDCVDCGVRQVGLLLEKVEREATDPVLGVVLMASELARYLANFCPSFYRDMAGHPKAAEKRDVGTKLITDAYREYFRKGKEEGYFLENIDVKVVSTIILGEMPKHKKPYQQIAAFAFLRGICTDKGIEILNRFVPGVLIKETENSEY